MDRDLRRLSRTLGQRVVTRLRCVEKVGRQRTVWVWALLDDGSLLELAPRGRFRYTRHLVLDRSSPLFQQLVAQDGVLVRFEARVRGDRVAAEPTVLTIDGREYAVRATGTAAIARVGQPPTLGGWRDISASRPAENVYFVLEALDSNEVVLGLWTRELCLSFGSALQGESVRVDSPPTTS